MNQVEFALEWFRRQPDREFTPEEIREQLPAAFLEEFSKKFSDPSRAVRYLVQVGRVQRSSKGPAQKFWYNAELDIQPEEFTEAERTQILERDDFKCRICGRGPVDGVHVYVGYAKSTRRGGKLDVENGRTLCRVHRWILETAQDSSESAANFRRLREKLPQIGQSPKATNFWNEFVELLKKYGVDPID
jgi:hypothetical protein